MTPYFKMTPGKGLFLRKHSTEAWHSHADWAGSTIDLRSTSGYCTYVWGNLVTVRSKKQAVVPRSSAKAEFQAFAHGVCYGIWLRRNGEELKLSIQERRCIVITRVLSA